MTTKLPGARVLALCGALVGCLEGSGRITAEGQGDARGPADARTGPAADADARPEPLPDTDAHPGPDPETDARTGPAVDAFVDTDARPGPDRDARVVPDSDATPGPDPDPDARVVPPDAAVAPEADAHIPFACQYGDRVEVGTVAARDADGQPLLVETSGLMQSRLNRDVFWAHNDNGNEHRLFALGRDGTYLASYDLDLAGAQDIEGLAMGPGPIEGRNYLYLGDVGANWRIWGCSTANVDTGDCTGCPNIPARCGGGICDCRGRELHVYRTEEPAVAPGQAFTAVADVPVETFVLRFPDAMLGLRQDVETMMVDPRGGDLYLVTKHTTPALLLRAAAPLRSDAPNVLEIAAELPWGGESQATGGDISADGWLVGVRRYGDAHVWERAPGATIAQAVQGPDCRISAGEIQAESFAFDVDGSGSFFSLSESAGHETVPLYRYPRQ